VKSVICVKREVVAHPTNEITGELIRELYGEDVCMVRHDQHTSKGAKKSG
jgi:zinc transport system ATP-binding protein